MVLIPIGSVVKLKDAQKRIMIVGLLLRNGDGKTYDYMGCPYPEGVLDLDSMMLFNHEDIEDISFFGLDDSERQIFIKNLEHGLEELGKQNEN